MKVKFGDIGRLINPQTHREHFSEMPIGEKFMVLTRVDLPGYDALAVFPNFPPQILDNGAPHVTGYLDRGSYEIVGSIFQNADLLKNSPG